MGNYCGLCFKGEPETLITPDAVRQINNIKAILNYLLSIKETRRQQMANAAQRLDDVVCNFYVT